MLILPNISQSKGNETMDSSQLIDKNINISFSKIMKKMSQVD